MVLFLVEALGSLPRIAPVDLGDVASVLSGLTTIAVVILTYFAVQAGRASAEAASAAARLADRQLQEAHRPLLVPEAFASEEIAPPDPPGRLPAGYTPSPVERSRLPQDGLVLTA